MDQLTQEQALRLAGQLTGQALKDVEKRCSVLAHFVEQCDHAGSNGAAWSSALRELHALHASRRKLTERRGLIQQALDCEVGDSPAKVPLPAVPQGTAVRPQRQVQLQARRRA
ncbi:MAG TPA: hypothetical protein VGD91_32385 [Trebonia sp.]